MHALWMLDTGSVMQGQQRPRSDCYSACLRSHERCHGAARCQCRLDVRRVPMSSSYGRFRPARPDACLNSCSLSMMRACMFWASTQLRCATASEGPSACRRFCRPAQGATAMPAPKGSAGEGTSCFRSCTRIHATTLNDMPTCCGSCLLPGWPSAEGGGSGPAPPLPPVVVPPAGTRPNLLTIVNDRPLSTCQSSGERCGGALGARKHSGPGRLEAVGPAGRSKWRSGTRALHQMGVMLHPSTRQPRACPPLSCRRRPPCMLSPRPHCCAWLQAQLIS